MSEVMAEDIQRNRARSSALAGDFVVPYIGCALFLREIAIVVRIVDGALRFLTGKAPHGASSGGPRIWPRRELRLREAHS